MSGRAVWAAENASIPNLASTPASKPAAISVGMRFITRSNHPVTPTSVMSTAHTIKAPTACAISYWPVAPAAANTAAPGVDHAIMTGFRSQSEGNREHKPIPKPKAHIHEAI